MVRDYLFDIAKIVEGAASGDYQKVVAYSEALADRLEAAGEKLPPSACGRLSARVQRRA